MKETQRADTTFEHSETYLNAVAKIADQKRQKEQRSYGMMLIATALAGGSQTAGQAPRIVVAARMFCILFAFLAPSLLILHVAF